MGLGSLWVMRQFYSGLLSGSHQHWCEDCVWMCREGRGRGGWHSRGESQCWPWVAPDLEADDVTFWSWFHCLSCAAREKVLNLTLLNCTSRQHWCHPHTGFVLVNQLMAQCFVHVICCTHLKGGHEILSHLHFPSQVLVFSPSIIWIFISLSFLLLLLAYRNVLFDSMVGNPAFQPSFSLPGRPSSGEPEEAYSSLSYCYKKK